MYNLLFNGEISPVFLKANEKKIGKNNQRGKISVYGGQKQMRDEQGKSGTPISDERSNDLLHGLCQAATVIGRNDV